MSQDQKVSRRNNLDQIKENEFNTRYWKAQNDLMEEIFRNEELMPKYFEHLDRVKKEQEEIAAVNTPENKENADTQE